MFKNRHNQKEPPASGGNPASTVPGVAGKLLPGEYSGEVVGITSLNGYKLVLLSSSTGHLHTERVTTWPPWMSKGTKLRFKIKLTEEPGYYFAERTAGKYRARVTDSKEPITDWLPTAQAVLDEVSAWGLKPAKPEREVCYVKDRDPYYPDVRRRASLGSVAPRPVGDVQTSEGVTESVTDRGDGSTGD